MRTSPFFKGGSRGILKTGGIVGRQSFIRRAVLPAEFVLAVMIISTNIYDFSRQDKTL